MTSSLSRCPIEDVLPWTCSTQQQQQQPSSSPTSGAMSNSGGSSKTILIPDRVETSGRFLLFVTAAHAVRSRNRVLWLSFNGAYTNHLIRQGMKKIGCPLAAAALPAAAAAAATNTHNEASENSQQHEFCTIRSIAHEFSEWVLEQGIDDGKETVNNTKSVEDYVRGLYYQVKEWLQSGQQQSNGNETTPCFILLDDVSALADLVGYKLAYAFVYQVKSALQGRCKSSSSNNNNVPPIYLLIRCAGDGWDSTMNITPQEWVGEASGGAVGAGLHGYKNNPPPWESSLLELSTWIVDVLPLQSGYLREAHGRILVTSRQDLAHVPVRYNYCLTDQAVYAIRLTPQRYR